MKTSFVLPLDLQLFAEGATAGEAGAGGNGDSSQVSDSASVDAGASAPDSGSASGSGSEDVTKQESFAKRLKESTDKALSEARAQWEADRAKEMERFKDYDQHKRASEYLQKQAGIDSVMTLVEEIELAELQERAAKEKVPAEVLKRIDQLEAKAAKADELEAAQRQASEQSAFEKSLQEFCADKQIDGKAVDHKELWKFMHENEIGKPEAALKAMRAELAEAKLATAREDAVKDYLKSKEAPRVEGGSGSAAQSVPQGGGLQGAEQRALARMRAARTAE